MPAGISFVHLRRAAQIIHDGGVIAYPTEGVFGLGCDPDRHEAVLRILALKQRAVTAGLIDPDCRRSRTTRRLDQSIGC